MVDVIQKLAVDSVESLYGVGHFSGELLHQSSLSLEVTLL